MTTTHLSRHRNRFQWIAKGANGGRSIDSASSEATSQHLTKPPSRSRPSLKRRFPWWQRLVCHAVVAIGKPDQKHGLVDRQCKRVHVGRKRRRLVAMKDLGRRVRPRQPLMPTLRCRQSQVANLRFPGSRQ